MAQMCSMVALSRSRGRTQAPARLGGDRHDHMTVLSPRPILVHSRHRRTGEAPVNRIDEPERPPDFFISWAWRSRRGLHAGREWILPRIRLTWV
jgi:hypothetical protein